VLKDVRIEAEPRDLSGKRASRKLARRELIPGILYGGADTPVMFQVDPRRLDAIIHSESGTNTLFNFSFTGKNAATLAMIKAVQIDPVSGRMIHADLLRITMDRALQVKVPVHLTGMASGVKLQGGILDFVLRDIEISCLPGDIPERIDGDVSNLALGDALKVQDLKIPENVKVLTDAAKPVATVVAPAAEKAEAAAATEGAAEAPAEPEVIKKGKAETAEAAAEGEAPKGEKAATPKGEKAATPKGEKAATPKGEKAATPKGEKAATPKGEKPGKDRPESGAGKEKGGR